MGEGCLAGPGKCRHNIGSVELFIVACRACLREEAKEHVAANPCAKGQRRQTTVGRAAWQSRGGVAEVVVANPSEDHEQAVTSDWRAGAQPDTPFARRLRGALVSEVLSSAASVPAVVPQVRQPCSAWRFTPRADVQEHHSGSGGSRRHGKQELGAAGLAWKSWGAAGLSPPVCACVRV